MGKGRQRRAWSWRAPFQFDLSRAQIFQEILAGIMGWQTVVTSFASYAALFAGDADLDNNAVAEIFMFVAGVSTLVFGLSTDLPFVVAPSVLYVARETGITIGGQLAAQALANAAATVVFACAVELNLVSYIPTALRIGAGCGVAMLVGVLGMRSVGLLVADAFVLPPFTWETAIGLAVVTAASTSTPSQFTAQKWIYVLVVPLVLTAAVYALIDVSKFQGYSSEERAPLSHWRGGSLGLVDFSALSDAPGPYTLYIFRTFLSIVINIASVLLVLIDTVCLQRFRGVWRSAGETDFSDAIGGTTKFRRMACAIPMMSFIGNLAGVTTQAAFVESMIVVFAGGKTGLSAVVAGFLFILSTVMWPLLPVLAPAHVSGALTIVVTLRFFTVIRLIDVTHTSNLLMFGIPVILVPFSFDFVDALCVATILGFLCGIGNKIMWQKVLDTNNKVKTLQVGVTQDMIQDYETRRTTKTRSRVKLMSTIGDRDTSSPGRSLPRTVRGIPPSETTRPLQTRGRKGLLPTFVRHKVLPDNPSSLVAAPQIEKEETKHSEAEQEIKRNTRLRGFDLFFGGKTGRQSRFNTTKQLKLSEKNVGLMNANHVSPCSASSSRSAMTSSRPSTSGGLRQVDASTQSKLRIVTVPIEQPRTNGYQVWGSTTKDLINGRTVHWKLALIATLELALKVISDQLK